MNPVVMGVADLLVFGGLTPLALPTAWHPAVAPEHRGRHMLRVLVALLSVAVVAFLAGLLGLGALAWVLWFASVAAVGVADVQSVRARRRLAELRKRALAAPPSVSPRGREV